MKSSPLSGVVMNVFAHRFTIKAEGKVHLAYLPEGGRCFPLSEGIELALKGERRPSEIKVLEISTPGRKPVVIEHKKPHHGPGHHHPHHHHREADPNLALRAAETAGWIALGEPRRKPEHFEVLARKGKGPWAELHVDLDGGLYKTKALPPDGGKWADRIA